MFHNLSYRLRIGQHLLKYLSDILHFHSYTQALKTDHIHNIFYGYILQNLKIHSTPMLQPSYHQNTHLPIVFYPADSLHLQVYTQYILAYKASAAFCLAPAFHHNIPPICLSLPGHFFCLEYIVYLKSC